MIITEENKAYYKELFKIKNATKEIKSVNIDDFKGKPLLSYINHLGFSKIPIYIERETLYRKHKLDPNLWQEQIDFLHLRDFLKIKGFDAIKVTKKEALKT